MQLEWRDSFWRIYIQSRAEVTGHTISDNGKGHKHHIFFVLSLVNAAKTAISSCEFGNSCQHLSISVSKGNHCDSYSSINMFPLVSTFASYIQTQKRQNSWLQDMTKVLKFAARSSRYFISATHFQNACPVCKVSHNDLKYTIYSFVRALKTQIHSFPFLSSHDHRH